MAASCQSAKNGVISPQFSCHVHTNIKVPFLSKGEDKTWIRGPWLAEGGGGGGYSHTLRIRVCAAQRGRDFEAPDLERGIHFRGVF